MHARLIAFGRLEIEGQEFAADVVIEHGVVRRRKKGPSKPLRGRYGHTPLSSEESIPWGGRRLIVGTGAEGRLPVTREVLGEAEARGIELIALPTAEACALLGETDAKDTFAILHVTC